MANYALQFDGSQNYINLGVMGSFGSSIGSGFYCKFDIVTTSTSTGQFGAGWGAGTVIIGLNQGAWGGNSSGGITLHIVDSAGGSLWGHASSTGFNNGSVNTIEITSNPKANTATIKVNGTTFTFSADQSGLSGSSTFNNFPSPGFYIGTSSNYGSPTAYLACVIDNLYLGTSSSVFYGQYVFDEGTGTTTADSSGNSNTGTLIKGAGAYPAWVTGLGGVAAVVNSNFLAFM